MSTSAERRSESICEQIVMAVADREGVDPLDLVPLYDVLGPGLRQSLFERAPEDADQLSEVHSFAYCGYDVTVDGEAVNVSKPAAQPEANPSSPR